MATATAPRALKGKDPELAQQKKAKVLFFGPPGVGKTWVSMDFANVYYIDVEGGATKPQYRQKLKDSGAAYMGPEDGSQDFDTVIGEVQTLATTKHRFKTLVIDSFSKLFNGTTADQEQKMVEANAKIEFGVEKKPAVRATRRMIRWIDRIDMNVLLVCHERPVWKAGVQMGETFDGWDKLEYELDLVLQIQKRGADKRVAIVRKTRLVEFPDGTTFDWTYTEFAKRYGKDTLEGDCRSIALATQEQVATLLMLVKTIRVEQDTIDKWLNKANVESFEEMDTATIQKCIDFLTKQMPGQGA